jgi:hypothetical protein
VKMKASRYDAITTGCMVVGVAATLIVDKFEGSRFLALALFGGASIASAATYFYNQNAEAPSDGQEKEETSTVLASSVGEIRSAIDRYEQVVRSELLESFRGTRRLAFESITSSSSNARRLSGGDWQESPVSQIQVAIALLRELALQSLEAECEFSVNKNRVTIRVLSPHAKEREGQAAHTTGRGFVLPSSKTWMQ